MNALPGPCICINELTGGNGLLRASIGSICKGYYTKMEREQPFFPGKWYKHIKCYSSSTVRCNHWVESEWPTGEAPALRRARAANNTAKLTNQFIAFLLIFSIVAAIGLLLLSICPSLPLRLTVSDVLALAFA